MDLSLLAHSGTVVRNLLHRESSSKLKDGVRYFTIVTSSAMGRRWCRWFWRTSCHRCRGRIDLAELSQDMNWHDAARTQQLRHRALLLFGEHWISSGFLGRIAPEHGARPWRRRLEEEEALLPSLDFIRQPCEEHTSGVLRGETVEALNLQHAQREEVQENGDRWRVHAGGAGEREEGRHDAPAIGRELARGDTEVREQLAEEGVERDAHPGFQRVRVHADGSSGWGRARASVAGGDRGECLGVDAELLANGVDRLMVPEIRGDALSRGPRAAVSTTAAVIVAVAGVGGRRVGVGGGRHGAVARVDRLGVELLVGSGGRRRRGASRSLDRRGDATVRAVSGL
jgi:hypothetical protein